MNHPPQIKYAGQLYVIAADPQERRQRIQTRIMLAKLRAKMIPLQVSLARTPEAQQRIMARQQKINERLQKLTAQLQQVSRSPLAKRTDKQRLKRPGVRPAPRK
jgi:hypothetical protein